REKKPLLVGSFYGTLPDAKDHAEAAILRLKERSLKRKAPLSKKYTKKIRLSRPSRPRKNIIHAVRFSARMSTRRSKARLPPHQRALVRWDGGVDRSVFS